MVLAVVAAAIFVATLVVVIWQPKGFPIGYTALIGAVVALATTVVGLGDVPTVVGIVWNATLTFVAVVLISLILDEAGFFEWAALHVARWGRGNGRLLFVLIVGLGAVIAAVFANDGAALILTPIVVGMLRALNMPAKAALGFILATGFIADTGSLPLVVSNLVNIVSADYFGLGFAEYAAVMVPVGIVSVLASLGMLLAYFGRSIPKWYDVLALTRPAAAVKDRATFRAGWVVLAVLLVGYFAADPVGVPLAAVAGVGAVVIVLVAARQPAFLFARQAASPVLVTTGGTAAVTAGSSGTGGGSGRVIPVWKTIREAPWQIVLFSIGMYLVVYGLQNQGLTDYLAKLFDVFGDHGVLVTALGVGFVIAILASLMNNMPTVLIAALAIGGAGATGLTHEVMIYANVIGSDLGPKITPIGSLATLLWLHVLDRKGIHIGWGQYFRTGIVLTVPVLAVTLTALAGWLTLIR
ncbi:arsenical pump membrane protein [Curtobacterium luteum]|uniref:Arsenical pump membrane protein n=1 Tax=Curtobacterium luteum TaxID=33881 RepID=A0A8H9GBB7_9MICO|nr:MULTISPECIES: arsenic transporter [Curtobacterium]MBM7801331.1 arsenical pump membrane protein [Curtobacterium luteum]NUU50010.1 arsenic transporter [Curtobacterium luteum]GGL12735.1 arsenical pump membrane protein [Curtobacterium luteum]